MHFKNDDDVTNFANFCIFDDTPLIAKMKLVLSITTYGSILDKYEYYLYHGNKTVRYCHCVIKSDFTYERTRV